MTTLSICQHLLITFFFQSILYFYTFVFDYNNCFYFFISPKTKLCPFTVLTLTQMEYQSSSQAGLMERFVPLLVVKHLT